MGFSRSLSVTLAACALAMACAPHREEAPDAQERVADPGVDEGPPARAAASSELPTPAELDLWKRSCLHGQQFNKDEYGNEVTVPREEIERCVFYFTTLPRAQANEQARCYLEVTDPKSDQFDRCLSPETRAARELEERRHEELQKQLEVVASMVEAASVPESLADIDVGHLEDPWGTSLRYEKTGSKQFELCSAARDGTHGTLDDVCHAPSFIYFQF